MKAYIDYTKLLKGEYKRQRNYGPFSDYDSQRVATLRTNDFADKNLQIKSEYGFISTLFSIIHSSRIQNDFEEIEIINFNIPFTIKEIEILERITLTNIELTFRTIKIKLLDKIALREKIDPIKSRTKLHPEYKTPEEIELLISEIIPKVPAFDLVKNILDEYNSETKRIMNEIKTATNNTYPPLT